jgi:hypothetical protein
MFEQASSPEPRNAIGDWVLRGGIAFVFVAEGAEKFSAPQWVGLALLACTMASAALILIFVVGRPADSVFSGALFIALASFWWNRRNR